MLTKEDIEARKNGTYSRKSDEDNMMPLDKKEYAEKMFYTRNHYNYNKYANLILSVIANEIKILDIASAHGSIVSRLLKTGFVNVFGIDKNEEYWNYDEVKELGDHLIIDDITSPSMKIKGKYDIVTAFDILEHISADKEDILIKNLCELCGKFLIVSIGIKKDIGKYDIAEVGWGGDITHVNVRGYGYWEEILCKDGKFVLDTVYTDAFYQLMGDKTKHGNEYQVFRRVS